MAVTAEQKEHPNPIPTVLLEFTRHGHHFGVFPHDDTWVEPGERREVPREKADRLIRLHGARPVPLDTLTARQRVERILRSPESANLGMREIGRLAGCAHSYVIRIAKELGQWPRSKPEQQEPPEYERIRMLLAEVY